MIPLRHGTAELGKWLDEEVNILEDYRKALGEDPPRWANLAVMGDSDNTGESSVAYIDFIENREGEGGKSEDGEGKLGMEGAGEALQGE